MKLLMENWRKFIRDQTLSERVRISDEQAQAFANALTQASAGGPGAVRQLMNSEMGKSIPFRKFLRTTGAREMDGSDSDDVVPIRAGVRKLSDLTPTQRFIDAGQSVAFPLATADGLLKNILNKKGFGPITVSGDYIIDGHHRWSGIHSIAPDGTISVLDFGFKGDAQDKLAAAQIAVAAVDPRPQDEHPSKGGDAKANIMGASASQIYSILDSLQGTQPDPGAPAPMLNDEMLKQIATNPKYSAVLEWAGLNPAEETVDVDNLAEAIKIRVAENLAQMNPMADGAPDRPDMPQMDHPSIGKSQGLAKIKDRVSSGDINLAQPFVEK
jgi:hypothetical protein